MSITGILIAAACVGIVGIFVGLFLGVAGIKFKVEVDEKEEAVLAALPGNNCGGCGFAGCSGLAAAIAKGEAAVNTCPVGGEEVGKKIAAIMGVEAEASERKVAYVHCQGDCERTTTDYDYYGIKDCRMMSFVPGGGPKSCNSGCLGFGTCEQACPFDAIHVENGVAVVDKEKCKACGKCVEVCPAGAVKLGQKLCTKDGKQVEYPKHPLPSEMKWGPHMWDENYRDNNRINCYDTGTAPCKTACPAHIAVQGYLKMAAQGRYTEALALIKKDNPLPAICGRICNRRCEDACTRGSIDQAIAIDEVKKFIAQQDLDAETRYIPKKVVPSLNGSFSEKVAIIGAGPAGLSCAFYLAEKGYSPVIFEKNEKPGGMLRYGIPSFKLEKDVIDAEIDIIKAMGVEIKCGIEVGKDVTLDELRAQGYKAFYIAIGCQGGRKAGIPGEDAEGVMTAVDFLRTVGADESYPVTGKAVVVGGGNVAIDVARTAQRCGAESVAMFCLEPRDKMPASEEEIAEALEEDVTIDCGWGPKEILTENGRVTGIVFKRCVSVWDKDGKFAPAYDENDTKTVPCDRVFLSIGQSILWGDLLKGSKVELGRGNGAVADSLTYQTAEPDIFVGGDVYTGPKFAIDAIAAGREGAISIHRFVQPHSSLTIGRNRREFIALDKDNIKVEQYDNASRQIPGTRKDVDHKKSFRDAKLPFTEEQVKAETARCLGCGASVVDPNKCIGCGVCTTKCEFGAIKLHRERPECSNMIPSEKKLPYVLGNGAKQALKIKFSKKKEQ